MKIIVSSLFVASLAISRVEGGAYQDGYTEGERRALRIWKHDYAEDCYDVFAYSIEVKDDVVNGEYKPSRHDNWRDEAFNRGGRHGASNEVMMKQKDCLDPKYCDELGKTAAELLVADFCGTRTAMMAQERSPVEMCRVSSTNTCKGFIVDKIEEAIDQTGSCDEIDGDIDNLTMPLTLDLQDECEAQVDEMIEWNEFKDDTEDDKKDEHDGRHDTKDSKSKKNKKKNKKHKKKKDKHAGGNPGGYNTYGGRKLREVLAEEAKSN
jgi:hypothetical protein